MVSEGSDFHRQSVCCPLCTALAREYHFPQRKGLETELLFYDLGVSLLSPSSPLTTSSNSSFLRKIIKWGGCKHLLFRREERLLDTIFFKGTVPVDTSPWEMMAPKQRRNRDVKDISKVTFKWLLITYGMWEREGSRMPLRVLVCLLPWVVEPLKKITSKGGGLF